MSEILTPKSNRWETFTDALDRSVAVKGCDGHRWAKLIMAEMGNIDISASLAFFQRHGGHCDCEILMNVGRD